MALYNQTPQEFYAMRHVGVDPQQTQQALTARGVMEAILAGGTAMARDNAAIPLTAGAKYLATPFDQTPDISAQMRAAEEQYAGLKYDMSPEGKDVQQAILAQVMNVLEGGKKVYDANPGGVKTVAESPQAKAFVDHLKQMPQYVKDGLATVFAGLDVATLGASTAGPGLVLKGANLQKGLNKIMKGRAPLADFENPISFTQKNSNIQRVPSGRVAPVRRVQSGASKGQYIGGPQGLTSSQGLGNLRNSLYATLSEGLPGRLWYDESSATIRDLTQGVNKKHLYAGTNAITSRGAQVAGNQGFGVKGFNQVITGNPANTGRFAPSQSTAIDQLGAGNYIGGPKETPFYEALTIFDRPQGVRPTNDIWVARAFGYRKPNGDVWDAGFSQQQHKFIDGEMQRLVNRANKQKLGGFSDWTPERVQASMWVAQKARDEGITVEKAAKNFSDNLDKMTASLYWESRPSTSLGHLPGVSGSENYNDIIRAALTTDDGRDRLALNAGALTRPTVTGYGLYGKTTSPSNQTRILGGTNQARGPDGKNYAIPELDPASESLGRSIAAGRNITMGQDVTGLTFQRPPTGKMAPRDVNGNLIKNIAQVDLGGTPDANATIAINKLLQKEFSTKDAKKAGFGSDEVFALHTESGIQVLNVGGGDTKYFQKRITQLYKQHGREFGHNSPNTGGLVGNVPWSGDPGYKVSTNMDIIDQQNLGPNAINRLEKGMQDEAATLLKVDDLIQKSVKTAGKVDSTLTLAREILVSKGLQGLRDAVAKGALPVTVLALLGLQDDKDQPPGPSQT